jgi:hypothetical protein
MQGHYGTRFLNMWKTGQILPDGTDAGIANAMNHWDKKLAGYASSPETIRKVLDNLPADPPSLPQFYDLLRHAHTPENQLAIGREHTKEEIAANKARLKELLSTLKMHRSNLNVMEYD